MITKSDWQAVHEKMLAEDRARLGEPPTAEELYAYEQGELSPAEEERIREFLVGNPELARTFAVPFPSDDAGPEDPDYLSPGQLADQWASLQRHIHGGEAKDSPVSLAPVAAFPSSPDARALRLWRRTSAALAAALVLTFGALLWKDQRVLLPGTYAPAVVDEVQIEEGGNRGGVDPGDLVPLDGGSARLRLLLARSPAFARYRLEIVNPAANPPQPLWSATTTLREGDPAFHLELPRGFLKPGRYRINAYGIEGSKERIEAVFTIRVPAVP
jgi:hypothetical protein